MRTDGVTRAGVLKTRERGVVGGALCDRRCRGKGRHFETGCVLLLLILREDN